jgi:predicted transcriptional regulator
LMCMAKARDATIRRSKLEIMLTVLRAVNDGETKPTKIMYASNMSWNLTQRVFADLVRQGLLDVMENPASRRSTRRYVITEKGSNVLRYFEGAKALLQI